MAKKKNVRKYVDGLSARGALTWKLEGHRLTIGGNGRMRDFTDTERAPWAALGGQVRSVVVEDGVENIGGRAFLGFENLEEVRLGRDVGRIGWRAFDGCGCLETVTGRGPLRHWRMPPEEGTVAVGHRALRGTCAQARELVICDGVVLEYTGTDPVVRIPRGVREIAPFAFAHMKLESVTFPATLERVGAGAFYDTGLKQVTLPAGTRQIDDYAFGGNPDLREVFQGRASVKTAPTAFTGTPVADDVGVAMGRWRFAEDFRTKGFRELESGKWSVAELHRALCDEAVLLMVAPGTDGRFDVHSCCYVDSGEYAKGYTLWPCLARWDGGSEGLVDSEDCASFRQNREREKTWISIYGDRTDNWEREELMARLRGWKCEARWRGAKLFLSWDRGNFWGPLELDLCEKWLAEHPEAWLA